MSFHPRGVPPALPRRTALGALLALSTALTFPAQAADKTIKVGVMAGDGEEIMEQVAIEAAKSGLAIKIVSFTDYTIPNEAVAAGDLDANAFQHQPYLDNQTKARGYKLVNAGYTIVAPIGIYSHRHKSVADLPSGAKIGTPNDPTNGGRALLLLQTLKLLKLREDAGMAPTVADIVENPRKLKINELDAGIVARFLDDLDAAVINTNWALKAGLDLEKDRIGIEPLEGNPYRNIIAVRQGDENRPEIRALVAAYQSPVIAKFINEHYKGAQIPAW